jgi:hypothetical protein
VKGKFGYLRTIDFVTSRLWHFRDYAGLPLRFFTGEHDVDVTKWVQIVVERNIVIAGF